jgi:transposase
MRPFGAPKTLERRRRRAIELLESGVGLTETARRVGSSVTSVFRWRQAYKAGGDKALEPIPVPGRPRKLDDSELKCLYDILLKGAREWGFPNEIWTLKRIKQVIKKEFGVEYHIGHIWKILQEAGWSCQVPERRAIQRDEDEITKWKHYKWPKIKKNSRTWCPPRIHR